MAGMVNIMADELSSADWADIFQAGADAITSKERPRGQGDLAVALEAMAKEAKAIYARY
jgi:hypothetical protein